MRDELDRQIVELLRENGRRSNVEMAQVLGVSEGTVRKRLDRLLETNSLQVVGLPDPIAAGYPIRTLILLNVELAKLNDVGRALVEMPEVMRVYSVTGEHDLVAEALFTSNEHLRRFLMDQVATLEGVIRSTTFHVAEVLKRDHEWALPPPPPPRVLVVDDDPDFVQVTCMVLEAEGLSTSSAVDGAQALQVMKASRPDLVILDVMMDGVLDGWDAARRIRTHPALARVPILLVSSITASEYIGMFPTDEDSLADNFLSKPVNPQQLVSEVKRLLSRR